MGLRVLKFLGTTFTAGLAAIVLVVGAETIARANDQSFTGYFVVKTAYGTGAACNIATGAGDGCFGDDLEAIDDLDVGDAVTIGGATAISGVLSGAGTAAWGSVVAGANTACNTTCTAPCLFGINTAATEADIVACTDATADECLCFGAN